MSQEVILSLQRVSKAYGKKVVLDNMNLSFFRGARIGVIGPNGSGKSSLLKVLAGVETEFEGTRWAADNLRIGYVPQEPRLKPGTVKENLEEAVGGVRSLLERYERLNERLAEPLEPDEMQKVLDELERVQAEIEAKDAWELDRQLEQASHALGLPALDADVSRCSGGERRRVALCKVLLEHPDVLLLDEPTNHLDADAVDWLERHLAGYEGTVIAVTHDRYFLDNVAQWMLEMERGRGTPYHANYSAYLQEKQARKEADEKLSFAQAKLLERELAWIRQSPKARTVKNKARVRNFEALYEAHLNREKKDDAITLVIPPGDKLGQKVIRVTSLTKAFGERTVLKNVSFELPPGAVLGVIGPNGAGKTTLLKIISGSVKADEGTVELGPTVRTCFVDQDRAELDPEKSVWEEISDGLDELQVGSQKVNSRAYVAKFNFKSTDQQQKVGTLSGGQRNRVQMAKMLRRGGNLLLVDEPTNDLDVTTIQVLEDAIENFPGCAIVVSHDRFFLDKIATHLLAFQEDGTFRFWEGNYETYKEKIAQEREEAGLSPETRGAHRRLT
ncbi:MAG: energy-dependent translational throttle protein EttA [Planctomycetia bacterium]